MQFSLLRHLHQHWRDYYELCKPKVVALIVFTALVGMFLATTDSIPLALLINSTLGIGLAAASAATLNHLLDQQIDAKMQRTIHRPLPTGHLQARHAAIFSLLLGTTGLTLLAIWVNPLTAWLTFFSLIGYAVVYTRYLKRATPQNIVIGGAAGAAPPVLGWTAVTGQLDPHALLLFLIIFVWTPPHFWALAIHRRDDYARVNLPMLPVTHGLPFTRLHILLYTILLSAVTLLPFATHMSGWLYLSITIGLNIIFLYYAIRLMRHTQDNTLAMKTFGYSIIYLMGLFLALLLDHYYPIITRWL